MNHRCLGNHGTPEARLLAGEDVEKWTQQMRKGSTRLAILQLVSERDRYGYEIVADIKDRTKGVLALAEGNIYPALHAMESEGFITSYWREVEPGVPPRKYYRLTPAGKELHARLAEEWKDYAAAIGRLLKGGS